jgi:hypothetical protein
VSPARGGIGPSTAAGRADVGPLVTEAPLRGCVWPHGHCCRHTTEVGSPATSPTDPAAAASGSSLCSRTPLCGVLLASARRVRSSNKESAALRVPNISICGSSFMKFAPALCPIWRAQAMPASPRRARAPLPARCAESWPTGTALAELLNCLLLDHVRPVAPTRATARRLLHLAARAPPAICRTPGRAGHASGWCVVTMRVIPPLAE